MIVSHRHKFIFIHCRKVAGSSMKVTLAPHLGREDLILGSLHEILRDSSPFQSWILREMATPSGVSELLSAKLKRRDWRSAFNKVMKKRQKRSLGLSSSSHPPASDVRDAFPDIWNEYFKFCFVRNPYERIVSDYLYQTRLERTPPSFSAFLEGVLASARGGDLKHDNWSMYTIDDQVAVDFVGRFENLEGDFSLAMQKAGLDGVALTASEKRRSYPKPWQAYYGPGDKERVDHIYGKEISHFDYVFEESQ
ncbi:MAG: sulfotransferase family 2 domain-containing protein [Ectothiorhodospiraceae bacterium]|nr:sulfotransferase family 2 domain-containing protein [Ectothiorhodospiraceae bacterium]MCH8503378.1 sulfotransferase family protein [Ectothiorhodospiraceae bacterium]